MVTEKLYRLDSFQKKQGSFMVERQIKNKGTTCNH